MERTSRSGCAVVFLLSYLFIWNRLSLTRVGCAFAPVLLVLSWCVCASAQQSVQKGRLLQELTVSDARRIAGVAATAASRHPSEASQLAIDLSVAPWIADLSELPLDIRNLAQVSSALRGALDDPTIDWAARFFSDSPEPRAGDPVPLGEDPRVVSLSELKRELIAGLEKKDSYPVESVSALRRAQAVCRKLRLELTEAIVLGELGEQYLYSVVDYRQAAFCYETATWTFSAYGLGPASAMTYSDWGTLKMEMGQYAEASNIYIQSARRWLQLAEAEPSRGEYRLKSAQQYMLAADATRAAGDGDAALELMVSYGLRQFRLYAHSARSYEAIVRALVSTAAFRRDRGDTDGARSLLEEAQKASVRQTDNLLTAVVFEELSKTYKAAGHPALAAAATTKRTQYLQLAVSQGISAIQALEKRQHKRDAEYLRLARAAEQAAAAYILLDDPSKSVALWRRLVVRYTLLGNADDRIRAERALAGSLAAWKRTNEAAAARQRAFSIAMGAQRRIAAASILEDSIDAAVSVDERLRYYSELLELIDSIGNVRWAAQTRIRRGDLLAEQGRQQEALADYQWARINLSLRVGDPWASGEAALKQAACQSALGRSQEARDTLETAVREVGDRYESETRGGTVSAERKSLAVSLNTALVERCLADGDETGAVAAVNRAKRFSWFGEWVGQLKKSTDPGVAAFAVRDIGQPGLGEPDDGMTIEGRVLASNWTDFAETCWTIAARQPATYNALPVNPMEFYRYRNSLPSGYRFVQYMALESSLVIFVCGRGKSMVMEYEISRSAIDSDLAALRRVIRNCEESLAAGIPVPPVTDWQQASFLEMAEPLHSLYLKLLASVDNHLTDCTHVVFALPLELAGIPMHCLLLSEPGQPARFVTKDYYVSYIAPGMLPGMLDTSRKPLDVNRDALAVFADPKGELPGARREAEAISGIYGNSRVYVGELASRDAFLRECGRSSVMHLAVHHAADANFINVEFALSPDSGGNGTVKAADLLGDNCGTLRMIVLSACDSIGSADPLTSGPVRTAELLALAGAETVIGGLWKVSDNAAYEMMSEFYKALASGVSRSGSIRQMQTKMIESGQYAHPFYWGTIALYGRAD